MDKSEFNQSMKRLSCHTICLLSLIFGSVAAFAQSSDDITLFSQRQKARLEQFKRNKQEEMKNYRDSINKAYTKFLEQQWATFQLFKEERGFKPMPEPPVYDPVAQQLDADDKPQQLIDIRPLPRNEPAPLDIVPELPEPEVTPVTPQPRVPATFFGTRLLLQPLTVQLRRLASVSEQGIADYWDQLSAMPVSEMVQEVARVAQMLSLDDWGTYQLINTMFDAYVPDGTDNERVVFSAFMLNQLDYGAKIGRSDGSLFVLLATHEELSNTSYFMFNGNDKSKRFYVINPQHKDLTTIQTCNGVYGIDGAPMRLSVSVLPVLTDDVCVRELQFDGRTYEIDYNRNLIDYYATFPYLEFSTYANAPLDGTIWESIRSELAPQVAGKSQEDAVNFLLHFVQRAFSYKTDQEQYGYEKWNFADETLVSSYSDCEDRAVLFAQLVKGLLAMDVVLVHYPGVHLAAAVHFDNPQTTGTFVMVDGRRFLICDPTYINANLGMAMPQLAGTGVEIIVL